MNSNELYVVTGASGRTGFAVASTLLEAGKRVRVVVRDENKASIWAKRGAEVAVADLTDISALSDALSGVQGAYIMSPQQYASSDLFAQAEVIAGAIAEAATRAQLPKLVALSSIGAEQSSGTGWIAMNRVLEQNLRQAELPVTLLRAAYFMQNWEPMVKAAIEQGELSSFLSPLDRKLPMISTDDVGRIAAEALCEKWQGTRIIEAGGPAAYSPSDVASGLYKALGTSVNAVAIPESDWSKALSGSGMSVEAVDGFIEMTRSLNSGHIAFPDEVKVDRRKGSVSLDVVIASIVASF